MNVTLHQVFDLYRVAEEVVDFPLENPSDKFFYASKYKGKSIQKYLNEVYQELRDLIEEFGRYDICPKCRAEL